jgi:hypothetical protein
VGKTLGGHDLLTHQFGIEAVSYLGTGMLMIRADLFRRFDRPWFRCTAGLTSADYVGNDMFFCWKVPAPVICDFDLSRMVGHTGQQTFRWSDAA